MVMRQLADDLRAEGDELRGLLAAFTEDDWRRPTPFKGWTPETVLRHLTFGDWLNMLSIGEPERFAAVMERRRADRAAGRTLPEGAYLDSGPGQGAQLLAVWHTRLHRLCDLLASSDPRARIKWVGPDMSIRSAATARLMETWAHGQDVYDMLRAPRTPTDRLRHIAVLGVNTFAWSFRNRGLEPPGPPPFVRLAAPSGAEWTWNEPDPANSVEGPALDFCHVVTQGRNIAEVGLAVTGETAVHWMAIAQCFAGPPQDPPPPGLRGWHAGSPGTAA